MDTKRKTAFIALVGRPNVGKSTLLNALLGVKVSIVSPKPQTTRQNVRGILTKQDTQLVFLDTPGMHSAKNRLDEFMMQNIRAGLSDADAAILVVQSGDRVGKAEERLLAAAKEAARPVVLVINKIDLRPKEEILSTIAIFSAAYDFAEIIPVSATQKDGLEILEQTLLSFGKVSPFFYDEEAVSDMDEGQMISEIAREKLLYYLQEEVPHGVAVSVTNLEKLPSLTRVELTIFCEKDSHKAILIGKGGEMIKRIGMAVRKEVEFMYDTKAFVECFVRVQKDWRNRPQFLSDMGYSNLE